MKMGKIWANKKIELIKPASKKGQDPPTAVSGT